MIQQITPIVPKENTANIAVMNNRWMIQKTFDGKHSLNKTYSFRTIKQRNSFIKQIISYELHVQHYASIFIKDSEITFELSTDNLNIVTEIDKEYASYCDSVYKDVTYSS